MANTRIRAEVILCPDKALEKDAPKPTWPRPAGLTVQFREVAGAADVTVKTNSSGIAVSPELPRGTYEVDLEPADLDISGLGVPWAPKDALPLTVDLDEAKHRQRITLIPPADHRLLPLLLCGDSQGGADIPLDGAEVTIVAEKPAEWDGTFTARPDGHVYALVPHKDGAGKRITGVRIQLKEAKVGKRLFKPRHEEITISIPKQADALVEQPVLYYEPAKPSRQPFRGISVEPTIRKLSGKEVPLTGAAVSVELQQAQPGAVPRVGKLEADEEKVRFPNLPPGLYLITVTPPAAFGGWPLKAKPEKIGPHYLQASDDFQTKAGPFQFEPINGIVTTPDDRPLDKDIELVIFGPDGSTQVMARSQKFAATPPSAAPLKIKLGPGPAPAIGGNPLEMQPTDQGIEPPGQSTVVALQYVHSISGRAVDESLSPMSGALIIIYDGKTEVARAVAKEDGKFLAGLLAPGSYSIAIQTEGGQPVTQQVVNVNPPVDVGDLVFRYWEPPERAGTSRDRDGDGHGPGQFPREAFTDLAAYPVLTEEVSTTGVPAPVAGGTGGGTAGAGYGQVVDQAMRDVLGWRPGGDLAGFQAALTGAFQLREAEGHTAWTWQQRGYAVQADMGALTGAQASIYARARAALDQIQPLLAGLTTLNPALYQPQDLEAIRTVVTAELNELVSELSLEGGPRIERVNELFRLLLGDRVDTSNLNPDVVQGDLGTLRDRFGLTVAYVDTVDEERIVTNFRIVVEQVLALQASWNADRGLLSRVGQRSSLGTILIWLSRGLEAVCESVSDLTFALDSVFVDAAQRQVIEIRFPNQAPLVLSDLLDWVVRACRDEGPRLIQDAGRDGVFSFARVLATLQQLISATWTMTGPGAPLPPEMRPMPDGMRTPRVRRAFQVLVSQLDEAARLAGLVQRVEIPEIAEAWLTSNPTSSTAAALVGVPTTATIWVAMSGTNFRGPATALLTPDGPQDLAVLPALSTHIQQPGYAYARFHNPARIPNSAGSRWLVSITNKDGTDSVPPAEVLRVPR